MRATSPPPPETRNRYADLLRVASILVVVIGHWLMAVLEYEDGSFVGKNLLEIATWTHILTWIFQVMPIFRPWRCSPPCSTTRSR